MLDRLDELPLDDIYHDILLLQNPDGSFRGDRHGEVDSRYSYCALLACRLMKKDLPVEVTRRAAAFVVTCQNVDGGFGCRPGSESHAGQGRFDELRSYIIRGAII